MGAVKSRVLKYEDTFAQIARAEGIGFNALGKANPNVDIWLPGEGTKITLPTAFLLPEGIHEGIIINLSEMRLYYFKKNEARLLSYPIGIGVQGFETPLMETHTVTRIEHPSWTPTASIRQEHADKGDILPITVLPGPKNPLGSYAIQLKYPGYFIHGTNKPIGVGQRVSHGCIRLYEKHIEILATTVPNGTPVRIIRQPHKTGWSNGQLYLESHLDKDAPNYMSSFARSIIKTAGSKNIEIDWQKAEEVARAGQGLPVRISQ